MSNLDKIDPKFLPQHVGIIMDGNGRWAAERHMPRIHGHRSAVKAVRASVETAAELGLNVLTLFAFSTENWQRPNKEVSALMELFYEFLEKELHTMLENNVRFQLIGDRDKLPDFLQDRLSNALNSTSENTGLLLNLAINYGGRDEISRAVRKISESVKKGELQPDNIDEAGILWSDSDLKIQWPLQRPMVTLRDSQFPQMKQIQLSTLPLYQQRHTILA